MWLLCCYATGCTVSCCQDSCGLSSLLQVLKVLHGARSDVEWLQRDFGIVIRNMFDTYEACRVLGMSAKGLGNLLQHYCGVEVRCSLRKQHPAMARLEHSCMVPHLGC